MNYKDYLGNSFNEKTGEYDLQDAQKRIWKEIPSVNVFLMGATGVGKSSLVNALFGENVAKTGVGEPVTEHLEKFFIKSKKLTIWDTKGIEAKDYQNTMDNLRKEINRAFSKLNKSDVPHVALLCIKESSARIEDREYELLEIAKRNGIPAIVVFTDKSSKGNEFFENAKKLLNEKYGDFLKERFVRVNSVEYTLEIEDQSILIRKSGLEQLIDLISGCLDESDKNIKKKFYQIQIVNSQKKLEAMQDGAKTIIHIAATAAGTAGASPIPGSDAPIIAAIQSTMIYKLNTEFEVSVEESAMTTIITGILGTTAVAQVGKAIVSNVLKFIPGAGSLIGGAISATTAVAITEAIGFAYLSVLENYYNLEKMKVEFPNGTTEILTIFKQYFQMKK